MQRQDPSGAKRWRRLGAKLCAPKFVSAKPRAPFAKYSSAATARTLAVKQEALTPSCSRCDALHTRVVAVDTAAGFRTTCGMPTGIEKCRRELKAPTGIDTSPKHPENITKSFRKHPKTHPEHIPKTSLIHPEDIPNIFRRCSEYIPNIS